MNATLFSSSKFTVELRTLEQFQKELLFDYWHHECSGNLQKALSIANRLEEVRRAIARLKIASK